LKIRVRKYLRRIPQQTLQKYKSLLGKVSYKIQPALWSSLKKECETWASHPQEIFKSLGTDIDSSQAEEFSSAVSFIEERAERMWPSNYDFGRGSAELLFHLVRQFKPEVVLETGVANGLSTSVMLAAMDLNNRGELHSIDTTRDVGHIFGKNHPRWHLHVTHGRPSDVARVAKEIGRLDFFLHDSDHSYWGQMGEFRVASQYLKQGGFILSDDVDSSWAFRDFCSTLMQPFALLKDDAKLLGLVQFPGNDNLPSKSVRS
jgi:predicted O-methyltransferase YrrM